MRVAWELRKNSQSRNGSHVVLSGLLFDHNHLSADCLSMDPCQFILLLIVLFRRSGNATQKHHWNQLCQPLAASESSGWPFRSHGMNLYNVPTFRIFSRSSRGPRTSPGHWTSSQLSFTRSVSAFLLGTEHVWVPHIIFPFPFLEHILLIMPRWHSSYHTLLLFSTRTYRNHIKHSWTFFHLPLFTRFPYINTSYNLVP